MLFPIECEYLLFVKMQMINKNPTKNVVKSLVHTTYSQSIKGRVSLGSLAILTMSHTRMYIGQTISVEEVLDPPPS